MVEVLKKNEGDFSIEYEILQRTSIIALRGIEVTNPSATEVILPDFIGCIFTEVQYSGPVLERLVLGERVKRVDPYALSCVTAKEVQWSPNCPYISDFCFYGNQELRKLTDIDGVVTTIGKGAFAKTMHLNSFSWPTSCRVISSGCFHGSNLETIDIDGEVSRVERCAFSTTWDTPRTITGLNFSKSPNCQLDEASLYCIDPGIVIMPSSISEYGKNRAFSAPAEKFNSCI